MKSKILRKLFLGFIQVHILGHGARGEFYGSWLIEHLKDHGYNMSPGTIYPILHKMEKEGLLEVEERVVEGKKRKYYRSTPLGCEVLKEARIKARELVKGGDRDD